MTLWLCPLLPTCRCSPVRAATPAPRRVGTAAGWGKKWLVLGLQGNEEALEAALREFDIRRLRRARVLRRAFFLVLAAFVLAGAANVLGGRSGTTAARGGGYELHLSYATVS